MAGLRPTVEVAVELAGVGSGWTVLTDVIGAANLVLRHGIDGISAINRVASTSTAVFSLRNDAGNSGAKLGYYSLHHANKRAGWALNIGCRVRLQDPATSTFYTRFLGKIDVIDVKPWTKGSRRVLVTAVGWLDEAARWTLTPEIGEQVNKRWDEVATAIVAEMAVAPPATSFDVGRDVYPYALDQSANARQSALTEFAKLAASEFGYVYQKADGTLRLEGRHVRLANTTSAWTLTDSTLLAPDGLTAASTRDDIVNSVIVTAHPKEVSTSLEVVYSQANSILIPAGSTKTLLGEYRDPVTDDTIGATNIQTQIAGTDYVGQNAAGGGADVTGSLSIVVSSGASGARFDVTNSSGSDVWLTTNQLRGQGITDRSTIRATAIDTASIAIYGERQLLLDMPYQANVEIAQGAANYILGNEATEAERAKTVTVFGRDSTTLTHLLTREISDRLTVQETVTGFNSAFFINAVELTVLPSGYVQGMYTLVRLQQDAYWTTGTSQTGVNTNASPF